MCTELTPRICIDCSPLLVRSAGVKTWLYRWLRALREMNTLSIRTVFEPRDSGLDLSGGVRRHPARLALLQTCRYSPSQVMNWIAGACDVFHLSNLLGVAPSGRRLSATLHDLTAWKVPECHRPAQIRADLAFADRILRRADGMLAVSEHTRKDAVELLGLDPRKIRVIYPGVAEEFFLITREQTEAALRATRISRPYFLFIGTIEPRKNVETLLDAWLSLPVAFRRETKLIFAGMPGWNCEPTLKRLAQMHAEGSGVRYLGFVDNVLLPGLTAGARALIYPSYYEGFGFPVAQAMAAGCPVITSNVSSLPEIAAEACLPVDPRSAAEIAAAIRQVDGSPALGARLSEAGRERSRLFTWRRAAEESARYFTDLSA